MRRQESKVSETKRLPIVEEIKAVLEGQDLYLTNYAVHPIDEDTALFEHAIICRKTTVGEEQTQRGQRKGASGILGIIAPSKRTK